MSMEKMSPAQASFLTGYANALQDVLLAVTGANSCGKAYDPMTINLLEGVIYSYAFNLRRGGRAHPLIDFESTEEIRKLMLSEVVEQLE